CSTSSSNPMLEDAMGGAGDIFNPSSLIYTDGAPHAEVRRPEPIPDHPRTWRYADRSHRDEPVELARCRYRAWGRAPAVEEARNRRERIAETAASMAGGSEESRTKDRAHCGGLRGRPRRLLVGTLAQGARHRGLRHPRIEHSGIARTPARQDRSSRHRAAQALLSRLAARRARSLQDGRYPDNEGRGCQAAQPRA